MKRLPIKNLSLAGMFLAIALLLPLLTGQIPQIGQMLLPMHLPVFICGVVCGWRYGLGIGLIAPILRSSLFGMPPMYPIALAMSFELATYGLVIGLLYAKLPKKPVNAYISLISSMLCGRAVWGAVSLVLLGLRSNDFTWGVFMGGAFLTAVPGIVLQLILVPALMFVLQKISVLDADSVTVKEDSPSYHKST